MSDVDMDRERDAIAETRDLSVLQDPGLGQPAAALSSRRGPHPEPVVQVLVSGCPLAMPEHALHEGLYPLRLSTEECVRLSDYTEAVALTLGALARRGIVVFPALPPSHDP